MNTEILAETALIEISRIQREAIDKTMRRILILIDAGEVELADEIHEEMEAIMDVWHDDDEPPRTGATILAGIAGFIAAVATVAILASIIYWSIA